MSENKRYYWLKLKEDFFEDDTIQWLEEQENGKDYVIFYLKLALKSLDDEGRLVRYVGETLIPYDIKALAKMTNTQPDTVSVAMKTFIEIGLVSRLDGGEIYMNQINEMIGTETDVARRVRHHRARKAIESPKEGDPLQCNNDVTKSNTEIEIDKEIDIDKEHIPFAKIIEHLNKKANKNFRPSARGTRKVISARWNEGYKLDDFIKVIDVCCDQWAGVEFGNGKMGDTYLQPSTLFNNKFDERLNWTTSKSKVPNYEVSNVEESNDKHTEKGGDVQLFR